MYIRRFCLLKYTVFSSSFAKYLGYLGVFTQIPQIFIIVLILFPSQKWILLPLERLPFASPLSVS